MTPRAGALLSLLAVIAISAVTCGGCAQALRDGAARAPENRSNAAERTLTVQISVQCSNLPSDGAIWGSGVVVSKNEVLTAAHVVSCQLRDPTTGQPVGPRGKVLQVIASQPDHIGRPMRVVVAYVTNDIARLRIADDGEFYDAHVPRLADVELGQIVCVSTGVPRRDVRCGIVEEKFTAQAGDVAISMPGYPGNSGSGVYDLKGRLVGILTQRRMLGLDAQVSGALMTSLDGREWALRSVLLFEAKP